MKYKLILLPDPARTISLLPPDIKRQVRAALEEIKEEPRAGKPLRDELLGFWTYRVRHFRIVYRIYHEKIEVEVIAVGPRKNIYEKMVNLIRNPASS